MLRRSAGFRRRVRGDILLGPVFFLGFFAAIAIPAYRDYTVRSQVAEGLNLAAGTKTAIAEYYATNGKLPMSLKDIGIDRPPSGQYVKSVTVAHGTIVIRYGRQANGLIANHQLTLRPFVTERDDLSF